MLRALGCSRGSDVVSMDDEGCINSRKLQYFWDFCDGCAFGFGDFRDSFVISPQILHNFPSDVAFRA